MKLRDLFTRSILGACLAFACALPSYADPTPTPTPTPTSAPVPSATPVADPSPVASDVPSPSPSGSYKEDLKMAALATSLLLQAQSGDVDRSMLETKMNLALSPTMVQSVSTQLAPLGKPKSVTLVSRSVYGEYVAYKFRIVWNDVSADESFALNPDGKIVAWQFQPA